MRLDTALAQVNDAFVMDAWGKSVGAEGKVLMLADGSALFAKAIGAELDLADKGLGVRSRRYAMLVDDGVVKVGAARPWLSASCGPGAEGFCFCLLGGLQWRAQNVCSQTLTPADTLTAELAGAQP